MPAKADKDDKLELPVLYRSAKLERSGFNKEKRTISVIFSSEEPVMRWFGEEILDHSAGSVDLDFLNSGGAVLMEHDVNQRVGIVEAATINAKRQGEAVVRFARTPAGDAAMAEIEDDTLRWLSVGYRVSKFQTDEDEEEYRAISWEPLECSFVAIPADQNAKVLRSSPDQMEVQIMRTRSQQLDKAGADSGGGAAGVAAPNIITAEDFSRALDEAREIMGLVAHYQRTYPEITERGEKAIKDKTPIAVFQRGVLELISTKQPNLDLSPPSIGNGMPANHRGAMSIGERFVRSQSWRDASKIGTLGALRRVTVEIPDEYQFRSDPNLLTRTTFSATTEAISGASGANIAVLPGIPGILNQQPLYVADLFAQGATTGDLIRFIQEQTFTNAATRVAEGAAKPEASLDVGVVDQTVQKTAAFLKVTDEMLKDFAQMQSFINARLAYMVQALEDQQLLTGSGTNQIKGVLNQTGLQTTSGAADPIDAIARAAEFVRGANAVGFAQPDAIILNPLDWLTLKLKKDANGQYIFGGPAYAPYGVGGYSNVAMMWSLPVVATTSMTRGTGLVGAFRMGAQIFRRAGLTLDTTNSDQDDFIKNLITIRAEQRMALAVYQPNKFCTVTAIPS